MYTTASQLSTVPVILSELEAFSLAKLLASVELKDLRCHATDDTEAFHMRSGLMAFSVALTAAGFTQP